MAAFAMRIPQFLLEPFEAVKLNNPSVILLDNDSIGMSEEVILKDYAYIGPSGLNGLSLSAPRKTFFAERYGGVGIGSNGGGARCGTDGLYIVKGMGPNQLLGVDSDFWYGHGTLPLVDAVAEAIWAKILKHALPYGAVDIPAVIATGGMSWTRERGGARKRHPGALLIREATLRLASFERAIYFKPKWGLEEGFINKSALNDVERTRSAINFLPSAMLFDELTDDVSLKAQNSDKYESIVEGLRNIGKRIAMQSAAASAKKIMHGALTGSNIALDARWMDLGCVTGMSTFGLSASFKPSIWREYRNLNAPICNILFYYSKYNDERNKINVQKESLEICDYIDRQYNENVLIYLLSRCGFPIDIARIAFSEPEVLIFAEKLLDIAQSGTAVDHDRFHERGGQIGSYNYYDICVVLSSRLSRESKQLTFSSQLGNSDRAVSLIKYYDMALSVVNSKIGNGDGKISLDNLINVNCIKSSFVDRLFSRNALNDEIEKAITEMGGMCDLRSAIEKISMNLERFSRETLMDNVGLTAVCGEHHGEDITYCATRNSFLKANGAPFALPSNSPRWRSLSRSVC